MWNIFSLFLSVIYVSYAEEYISTNSAKSLFESRIIGGSAANIVDHPHHVAVLYGGFIENAFIFQCGGSLIAWNWVLTAAHCTYEIPAEELKIRAGSKYWNKLGILVKVIAVYNNPNYIRETLTHDSSLMKTAFSLQSYANTYNVGLIGLATSLPSIDKNVIVAGWGVTSTNGNTPQQFRSATLKLIDRNLCKNLDNSMFCAGKWSGGLGVCFGDSGGGLRYGQQLIGIASHLSSSACGIANNPDVYISVPFMRDWILDTMRMN